MEITWYGHSCFRLTEKSLATTIIDPYDGQSFDNPPLSLKGDIVTLSHDKPGHNYREGVKDAVYTINGPGEYEMGGVFITGIQTSDNNNKEDSNILFLYTYSGINIVHLGALNRVPSQSEVEDLGTIHVLLIPISGENTLDAARAAEVVNLFDPNIVIPMHYFQNKAAPTNDLLSRFLKQMGAVDVQQPLPSLKLNSVQSLSEDTRVVVLEQQAG
jgi:L-ascorbate metabolism protein UlaG (beta-lactamase superfamily)